MAFPRLKVILSYLLIASGGALLGYLYWYYVGCTSGTCPITSSPVNSSLYGAVFFSLLLGPGSFRKGKSHS